MSLKIKEALFRASLLGGILSCGLSPSYGMMFEKDDISSLPSIERKIRKREQKRVENPPPPIEDLMPIPSYESFASFVYLCGLLSQREQTAQSFIERDELRTLSLENTEPETPLKENKPGLSPKVVSERQDPEAKKNAIVEKQNYYNSLQTTNLEANLCIKTAEQHIKEEQFELAAFFHERIGELLLR